MIGTGFIDDYAACADREPGQRQEGTAEVEPKEFPRELAAIAADLAYQRLGFDRSIAVRAVHGLSNQVSVRFAGLGRPANAS